VVKYLLYPGMAQLVARLTGGQEAVGSSPATRTKKQTFQKGSLLFYFEPGLEKEGEKMRSVFFGSKQSGGLFVPTRACSGR
jgi:hypothetical protein